MEKQTLKRILQKMPQAEVRVWALIEKNENEPLLINRGVFKVTPVMTDSYALSLQRSANPEEGEGRCLTAAQIIGQTSEKSRQRIVFYVPTIGFFDLPSEKGFSVLYNASHQRINLFIPSREDIINQLSK